MAIFDLHKIFERRGYKDSGVTELANNREGRARLAEIAASIAIDGKSYLGRTSLSAMAINKAGKQIDVHSQIVITREVDVDQSIGWDKGKPIDRIVDLKMSTQYAGGLTGIIPFAPNQSITAVGRGGKHRFIAESNKMAWGTWGVTEDTNVFDEQVFAMHIWTQFLATLEDKMAAYTDILDRCAIFDECPFSLGETDKMSWAHIQDELLPTFGEGFNKTTHIRRYFVGQKTSIDQLDENDFLSAEVLSSIEQDVNLHGIYPLNINGYNMNEYGIYMTDHDRIRFFQALSTVSQSIFNSAYQSNQNFMEHPLYKGQSKPILDSWNNFIFFTNNNLSSDPTQIEFVGDDGQKRTLDLPALDAYSQLRRHKMNGTAFSPRAYVYGIMKGNGDWSKFEFDGEGSLNRELLKKGTKTANDIYILADAIGAINFHYVYEYLGGRADIGDQAVMRHTITAQEAALPTCDLSAGSMAAIMQLGDTYNIGGAQSDKKWKIVYSGPFSVGSFTKGNYTVVNALNQVGQTVVGHCYAFKVLAIYEWDANAKEWKTTPVSAIDLQAVLDDISATLMLDTDGLVLPARDAAGTPVTDPLVDRRRAITYFNMSRTLVVGQGLMYKLLPIGGKLSGTEDREYGFFKSQGVWVNEGRKKIVDQRTGHPMGAIEVIYYSARS